MLRAVTFDLWETLVHEDLSAEAKRRAYRVDGILEILTRHGLDVARDSLERAHRDVIGKMEPYWRSNMDVSVLEQLRFFLELAFGGPVEKLVPAAALLECATRYSEAILDTPPRPAEGATTVLTVAHACGLRLGLICNTGRTPGKVIRKFLEKFGMLAHLDYLCFSDEARLRKPAKDVFLKTLQRLGVEPAEAIHVGDQADTDLAGAQAAGMRSIYLWRDGAPPAEADYVIRQLSELPNILGKLSEGASRGGLRPGDETVIRS